MRIFYPPILLGIGVIINLLLPFTDVPRELRWTGIILILGGLLVARNIARRFVQAKTDIRPDIPPSAFLSDGLFAYTRNPIYCAMVAALIGVSLVTGSLLGLAYVPIFISLVQRLWITREERNLEAQFGQAYLDYKARVRRWF